MLSAYSFTIDKLNANVAPLLSELFSARILPPWASIIPLHIYNPSPVPVSDLVANILVKYLRIYAFTAILYANNNLLVVVMLFIIILFLFYHDSYSTLFIIREFDCIM